MSMKEKIKMSLNSSKLDEKFLQKVKGGDCRCGCHYASDPGGSSMDDNWAANNPHGWHTPGHDYPERA